MRGASQLFESKSQVYSEAQIAQCVQWDTMAQQKLEEKMTGGNENDEVVFFFLLFSVSLK
jgi:hypothetical protein